MNDLILITYNGGNPTVSGRALHEALDVDTRYNDWIPRMVFYGFEEGKDFNLLKIEQVQTEGNREVVREIIDHELTLDMAKEIAMIQRTDKLKPYANKNKGYFSVKEYVNPSTGATGVQTMVTVKGREYFITPFD